MYLFSTINSLPENRKRKSRDSAISVFFLIFKIDGIGLAQVYNANLHCNTKFRQSAKRGYMPS